MANTRKVNAKGVPVVVVDRKEYLKNAPEGFDAACDYIRSAGESLDKLSEEIAVDEFKDDKKVNEVLVKAPCGNGGNDYVVYSFQRERTFPNPKEPGTSVTKPYVSKKAKTTLLGTNAANTTLKERFKDAMSKI